MPVYALDEDVLLFPPANEANADGLLAIGGKLTEDWLLTAYSQGLFPWFDENDPILWWSPDPRLVLFPEKVHISKSMHPMLNNTDFEFRLDTNFRAVIEHCAHVKREGQQGTWLTPEMVEAYCKLHESGMAHSAEIYHRNKLVGGLYGVAIGRIFFGESMFSGISNASKLCLIRLCNWLTNNGYKIIDCQVYSEHLSRMGAEEIPRSVFLQWLDSALKLPGIKGKWEV